MDRQKRGVLATLIGGICWGLSGTSGQYLMSVKGMDSSWLTSVRLLISGIILLLYALLTKRKELVETLKNPRDMFSIFIAGIFGLMLCQYTYIQAIRFSNAGTATVLQYTGPIFIVMLVCLQELRLPRRYELIAILLAFFGVVVLSTHLNFKGLAITPKGLFWGLLAGLGVVFYTMIPRKIMRIRGTLIPTALGMFTGGVIMSLIVRSWTFQVSIDFGAFLGLVGLIFFGSAVAFTLYLQGVNDIGPVRASLISSVEPVSAVIFSMALLGTKFHYMDLIGFVMILSTIFILSSKKRA